jgi:hypothetical protein
VSEGIFSITYYVHPNGFGTVQCGKLPEESFGKDEIPKMFDEELGRITGILITPEETKIRRDVGPNRHYEDYAEPRKYFLDNGWLGGGCRPKTRVPGQRWRIDVSSFSNDISAAFQRIAISQDGQLTVEDRITRWGLIMFNATRIQDFRRSYLDRPQEWERVLRVIDVREEDIQAMCEFAATMPQLDPIHDLIPIRVLEVMSVFRVMFRLSLHQFELAYDDDSM